jgi:hypothetical protein
VKLRALHLGSVVAVASLVAKGQAGVIASYA